MHPNRGEALSSSRSKMRAITGAGGGGSSFTGMSPFKRPDGQGVTKSYHSHDKQFVAHGGKTKKRGDKFARGGRTKDEKKSAYEEFSKLPRTKDPHVAPSSGWSREDLGDYAAVQRGGRAKRADGGRTNPFLPRPTTSTGGNKKTVKGKGNITVNLMMPQHHHPTPPGGGMGALAGGPPGGAPVGGPGGPGGAPAAAPMNPLAGAAAMGGMPGAAGGMPGGANPQAMQALQAIAGGGGGLGGGMPGRGPFARGGAAKSIGLTSNMGHWKNYASKNVKHNTAHERGATGESEELPLKTPTKKAGGGRIKVKAHSRGGPTRKAGGGEAPFGRNRSDPSGIPSIGKDWIGPGANYGGGSGSQDYPVMDPSRSGGPRLSDEPSDPMEERRGGRMQAGGDPFRSRWVGPQGQPNHPGWGPPRAGVARPDPGPQPPAGFGAGPQSSAGFGPYGPTNPPMRNPTFDPDIETPGASPAAPAAAAAPPGQKRGGRLRMHYLGEPNRARGGRSPKIPVPIRAGAETGVGRKQMARIAPSWRR